ncbi:MAG: T9SS type A sorting domain-containing protein [Bacteroidota bacterium]|nr:T9SS type A sorting domain-containing protein [Bacteroidota bacterium]
MKKHFLTIIYLVLFVKNYGQLPANQKYGYYKNRLITKFVIDGDPIKKGFNLPITIRNTIHTNDTLNDWGDGTIMLGWYISVLATEYEVNLLNGVNTSSTIAQLYRALQTVNRLDSMAEIYYGGTPSLNGFFMRSDADTTLITAAQSLNPNFFENKNCMASPYSCGRSCFNMPLNCPSHLVNEESQDQLYHLVMGLSLTAKFCNIAYGGVNLSNYAKTICHRLILYCKQNSWKIKNPVTGNNVYIGEDMTYYSYGFATAGQNVTGINYSDAVTNSSSALLVWNILPTLPINNVTVDNASMYLTIAAIANKNSLDVDSFAYKKEMYIFPLLRQCLNGGSNMINDTVYTNLINDAPATGNFYYNVNNKSTGKWHCVNIFLYPNRKNNPEIYGSNVFTGLYHGMDFMLLHNLYAIKQQLVGLKKYALEEKYINIYPNPSDGCFFLTTNSKGIYKIVDCLGNKIRSINVKNYEEKIDISDLPKGIYFLIGENLSKKLVVSN